MILDEKDASDTENQYEHQSPYAEHVLFAFKVAIYTRGRAVLGQGQIKMDICNRMIVREK